MEETRSKHSGIPLTDSQMQEYLKTFADIEAVSENLYKTKNKTYNKGTKPKRRNQV